MSRQLFAALALLTSGALSCSESPTMPQPRESIIQPLCQLGCTETDPNPNAPGVFLGSGVTDIVCFNRTQTDADGDGLGDFCEKSLVAAFAPQLFYTAGDDVRREPHWASQKIGGQRVSIAYMLSYYRDTGSKGAQPGFGAHNGDSEVIREIVYYDETNKHWVLESATYSQHTGSTTYAMSAEGYPVVLEYPSHAGTYPKSWVSEGKHANYAHQNECNDGGFLDNDTCVANTVAARVEAGASLNVGSRLHRLLDCMPSSNPLYEYYGAGRSECYWTSRNFRGWVPDSVGGGDSGTSYSTILTNLGF